MTTSVTRLKPKRASTTTKGKAKPRTLSPGLPKTFARLHAATATGTTRRKDQATLTAIEQQHFLDGINLLNQRGIFAEFVSIHSDMGHVMHNMGMGTPDDLRGQQRFLPWHRVFLVEFENQLQHLFPDIAIPYWNWSKPGEQKIPVWLQHIQPTVHNVMEPRNGSIMLTSIIVSRNPLSQEELARRVSGLNTVLASTNYTDFATGIEGIHDEVHTWVGGTMADIATAAADPLFWMHHANVDRIWWQWQQNTPDQNPNVTGEWQIMDPWRYSEPDTRDITPLHYEYV